MHTVVLEYKNTANSSGVALQWSTNGAGGNIQQQVIPSTFLSPSAVHLNGSPLEIRVVPGEVSYLQSSTQVPYSVLTAGNSLHFKLISRDAFGNSREFDHRYSQFVSRMMYDEESDGGGPLDPEWAGRIPGVHAILNRNRSMLKGEYAFTITPTVSSRSVPLFTSLCIPQFVNQFQ